MIIVAMAMEVDEEFKNWVIKKVNERPGRIHEKWFRSMIYERAEHILKGE